MTLAPGTTLGRYQVVEPLGSGGMATVYKAYQPALDRTVALKVIRRGFAEDPEFRERFQREARAIAKLAHPNIVQVHDFDETDGQLYLAMQYLPGGTLKARLATLADERRLLPDDETVAIVGQVASALDHAHRQGVIHRDVKPANVLLGDDGGAVVSDFGIAKILGGTAHTQTGVGIGTPEYMSPEQGQALPLDGRADLYSLAVMAFEMLTGALPYQADTPLAVVLKHLRDPLPVPSSLRGDLGPGVDRVLLRALAKDPADRYATTLAFVDALATALRERPGRTLPTVLSPRRAASAAEPVVAPAPVRPSALLGRPAVLALAGVALLVLGGGSAAVLGAFGTRTPTPTPLTIVAVETTAPPRTAPPTPTRTAEPTATATATPTAKPVTSPPLVVVTTPPPTTPPPPPDPCPAAGDPSTTGVEGTIKYLDAPIAGLSVQVWIDNAKRGSTTTGSDGRYRVVGLPVAGLVSVFPQLTDPYVGIQSQGGSISVANAVVATCGGRVTQVGDILLVRGIAISPISMFGTTSPGPKTMTWGSVSGASSYRVHFDSKPSYQSSCAVGFTPADTPVPGTSYATPALAAGSYYGFFVQAYAGAALVGEGSLCFGAR